MTEADFEREFGSLCLFHAKAAGAKFETEVLWATDHYRVLADGSTQSRRYASYPWGPVEHEPLTELARHLMLEHRATQVSGDWIERAAREYYGVDPLVTGPGVKALAAVFRKHAPKLPTVQEVISAYTDRSRLKPEYLSILRDVLRAAGLPEGEPAPGGDR